MACGRWKAGNPMPDLPAGAPDRGELLRQLHRIGGQLRAIAEHLRELAEELDDLVDQHLPPVSSSGPMPPPSNP